MTSSSEIGNLIRNERKRLGITQKDVALAAGTGLRFLIELEQGKPTVQLDKVLQVLQALGMELEVKGSS